MSVKLSPATISTEIRVARHNASRDYLRKAERLELPPLTAAEKEEIRSLLNDPKKAYVGIGREILFTAQNWAMVKQQDGHKVWLAQVHSPDALSVKIRFTDFDLQPGMKVVVYGFRDGGRAGVYRGRGLGDAGWFWSLPVAGDTMVIEFRVPDELALQPGEFPFRMNKISHTFRDKDGNLAGVDFTVSSAQSPGNCDSAISLCPAGLNTTRSLPLILEKEETEQPEQPCIDAVTETRNWYAWVDFMPLSPRKLYVTGEVQVPDLGVMVTLEFFGSESKVLKLELVHVQLQGILLPSVNWDQVRYEEILVGKPYELVKIIFDGCEIKEIPVQKVY